MDYGEPYWDYNSSRREPIAAGLHNAGRVGFTLEILFGCAARVTAPPPRPEDRSNGGAVFALGEVGSANRGATSQIELQRGFGSEAARATAAIRLEAAATYDSALEASAQICSADASPGAGVRRPGGRAIN